MAADGDDDLAALLQALANNGFAHDSSTLQDVIVGTMQDAQYSAGAGQNLAILRRFSRLEKLTIREIRAARLGAEAEAMRSPS